MLHEKRIDFKQLAKPTNLQNSAVLRMLEEEEERKRAGKAGLKRVAWPPPPEDGDYIDFVEQGPVEAKTRGVGEYATYQSKSPTPQPQQQQQQQEQRASCALRQPSQFHIQPTLAKTWAPVTIAPTAGQPKAHQAASPSPSQTPPTLSTWSDKPPLGSWNSPQPGQETIIPVLQIESQQQSQAPSSFVEPPASIITLRAEPPISQESAPVYLAQPAAINPTSGSMRGDQKWPPASVKEQTEAENRARIELAKGPVFRPRRVNKDYSGFFAQHASTNNYPGYRAPPGTQYFTPAYQH